MRRCNLEIRHISGKKNLADSLSLQIVADALIRKGSVKNVNAEYVQKLRVQELATDQEIQDALHQLFKLNPQGIINLINDQTSPQGNSESDEKPSVIAAIAISKIQLDNVFTNFLYSSLQNESPYSDIF